MSVVTIVKSGAATIVRATRSTVGIGVPSVADPELAALAALTSAADTVPYFTGLGTAALASLTAFGRSLIAAVDAPAAKVALGLGLLASSVSGQTATFAGALTAARAYTLPNASMTLTGFSGAPTDGRVPYAQSGILGTSAGFTFDQATEVLQIGATTGTHNPVLALLSGVSGSGVAKVRMGTTTREWEMKVGVSPYTVSFDYIGTNAPLADAMTLTTSGAAAFKGGVSASSLTATGLIPGRVTYVTTGGLIVDNDAFQMSISASSIFIIGNGSTPGIVRSTGAAGTNRGLNFYTGTAGRWDVVASTDAESGSNAGSNFQINARNDSGTYVDTPLTIVRAAGGAITMSRPVVLTNVGYGASNSLIIDAAIGTANARIMRDLAGSTNGGSLEIGANVYYNGGFIKDVAGVSGGYITIFPSATAGETSRLSYYGVAADSVTVTERFRIHPDGRAQFFQQLQASTQLGVGTTPSTAIGINVTQTALAGTSQYGHLLAVTATSSATAALQMMTVAPATAASSFTCPSVQGFRYQNVTIGSGSSVTTQYAIRIDALSGAGTNYAFSSAGDGIVSIGDTTDASAIGTAAHVVAGGGSFAKSLWVGGTAGNHINIANATGELRVNGTKVVSSRKTGWTAQTATASRADLGASPTVGALASFLRALYDDLAGHGLIGA